MEVSEENLASLRIYLQKTLDPDPNVRKPAEKFLESIECNKHYALLLLYAIDKPTLEPTIRTTAAITFKNFIKRNWSTDEDSGTSKIDDEDRLAVKNLILKIMINCPESTRKQLSTAISIIGKYDFPDKWPNLLNEIIDKFQTLNFTVINGILCTAHMLFKKYRYECKSQKLWTEIKFVLDTLTKPLTALLEAAMKLIDEEKDANNLFIVYNSLLLICKIFYSLNCQDLPEFFEDNMVLWMGHFHTLLSKNVPLFSDPNCYDEVSVIEKIKSQICKNIEMYAHMYEEEFSPILPNFVTDVWNLLTSLNSAEKYDKLVSNALQFLATVAERQKYKELFADPALLNGICEKVIIPNIEFRESDLELFVDNPEEYIRRDIEGSDVRTRRSAACDLIKVLSRYFQEKITQLFGPYIQEMLSAYAKNPANWKSKNAALYLVISLTAQGQTQIYGVTQTNSFVNLEEFTQNYVIPELQKPDVNEVPVVKADCIKYMMSFRSVLPKNLIVNSFPLIVKFLDSESVVVHTFASSAIDKILRISDQNGLYIKGQDLSPLLESLISKLFGILSKPSSQENEYTIRALMRTLFVAQETAIPFLPNVLPQLINILGVVAKNPKKPNFNHFLFETLALSIKIVCKVSPQGVTTFENELFPVFQIILQEDVSEFIPYVFQLLSMLLEYHNQGDISEPYLALYPFLLTPALWERSGNIYPLVKLLNTYIRKCDPSQVDNVLKLSSLLGIFQKLIANRLHDHEGFSMMHSLIESCPTLIAGYMKPIFLLLFQRLSSSKTIKYYNGIIKFFCFYAIKYGASNLITTMDSIQPRIFEMVVQKVIIPEVENIPKTVDEKVVYYGIIKLLTESEELFNGTYSHLWTPLLQRLLTLFETDNVYVRTVEDPSNDTKEIMYDPGCSKLVNTNNRIHDPLPDVGDLRAVLAQSLAKLSNSYPGKVPTLIANGLTNVEAEILKKYMNAVSLQIT